MKTTRGETVACRICGKPHRLQDVVASQVVGSSVAEVIRRKDPDWSDEEYICLGDLNRFRSLYVQDVPESEKEELSELEQEVVESIREHELLAQNLNQGFDLQLTVGDRIADLVARFGGSWRFMILFGAVLVGWIVINTAVLISKPFDPFPFILLNLVLSCIAAIQAPVVMMSQNRQESKDRLRSEHDYQVNLKAELEIRHLTSKFDLLLTHQWQQLLEIREEVQTELIQQIVDKSREAQGPPLPVRPQPEPDKTPGGDL